MIIIQDYNLNKLKDFKRLMKHELDEDYYETFLSHLESLQAENKRLESQKTKLIQEKKEMRDEIESVRRDNYNLKDQYTRVIDVNNEYVIRNSTLAKENRKLREALEFYAHSSVAMEDSDYLDDHSIVYHGNIGIEVCGKLARETLKELEGEKQ